MPKFTRPRLVILNIASGREWTFFEKTKVLWLNGMNFGHKGAILRTGTQLPRLTYPARRNGSYLRPRLITRSFVRNLAAQWGREETRSSQLWGEQRDT